MHFWGKPAGQLRGGPGFPILCSLRTNLADSTLSRSDTKY